MCRFGRWRSCQSWIQKMGTRLWGLVLVQGRTWSVLGLVRAGVWAEVQVEEPLLLGPVQLLPS